MKCNKTLTEIIFSSTNKSLATWQIYLVDNETYKAYLIKNLLLPGRVEEKPEQVHELGISSHFYGL